MRSGLLPERYSKAETKSFRFSLFFKGDIGHKKYTTCHVGTSKAPVTSSMCVLSSNNFVGLEMNTICYQSLIHEVVCLDGGVLLSMLSRRLFKVRTALSIQTYSAGVFSNQHSPHTLRLLFIWELRVAVILVKKQLRTEHIVFKNLAAYARRV